MSSRRLGTYLILWLTTALSVAGQSSNVTQCIPDYAWSINSLGQTPCLVAAYLESLCGVPTSVDSIPPGTHYLGPNFADADPCRCSSVTYSMVSACGGCQGRSFSNWTTWSQNCPTNSFMIFPRDIPAVTEAPEWAYLNLTVSNNSFDPLIAQQSLSGSPIPTAPIASSTSETSTSTSVLSTTSTSPSSSSSGEKSKSNAGAIAGGVVGGLVFLAIIGLTALWWIMRKRRNAVQKDVTFDSRALVSGPAMSQSQFGSPPTGPSPAPFSHSLYDTSDLSTFPGSPITSAVYTTAPGSRRSLESVSPSLMQLGAPAQSTHGHQSGTQSQRGGLYTGAAEL
ncbi:hypothetical protein B0H34DRAFT_324144 [Crassisporium funariophilum]|nr:hypothetical protein B0H34DRAFT_324144 [Crassisporium funariophilum]